MEALLRPEKLSSFPYREVLSEMVSEQNWSSSIQVWELISSLLAMETLCLVLLYGTMAHKG